MKNTKKVVIIAVMLLLVVALTACNPYITVIIEMRERIADQNTDNNTIDDTLPIEPFEPTTPDQNGVDINGYIIPVMIEINGELFFMYTPQNGCKIYEKGYPTMLYNEMVSGHAIQVLESDVPLN